MGIGVMDTSEAEKELAQIRLEFRDLAEVSTTTDTERKLMNAVRTLCFMVEGLIRHQRQRA